jgi:hypothetical protein
MYLMGYRRAKPQASREIKNMADQFNDTLPEKTAEMRTEMRGVRSELRGGAYFLIGSTD